MLSQLAKRTLRAFAAPHGLNTSLEAFTRALSISNVRGMVSRAVRPTRDSVTLTIRLNSVWRGFVAGQFVELTVEIDGVKHRRCYSMANSDTERWTIELTTKGHEHGRVSSYLRDHAGPGLPVTLSQAMGEFCLPDPLPRHLLLISGGSGITPVMSMLRSLVARGARSDITFLHYCARAEDSVYRNALAALAAKHPPIAIHQLYTRATDQRHSRLTAEALSEIAPAWLDSEVFVCGPFDLMDAARDLYAAEGREDQVHQEAFGPRQPMTPTAAEGRLTFSRSGRAAENDGQPILVQAEEMGLSPPHGCRMGVCHTCVCSLKSGVVRDTRTGELVDEADTMIQICVSAPVGNVSVDL